MLPFLSWVPLVIVHSTIFLHLLLQVPASLSKFRVRSSDDDTVCEWRNCETVSNVINMHSPYSDI